MAIYNYTLDTFLSTPTTEDKVLKIFNLYGVLNYTVDPNLSYYYYKNNFVFIKVENQNDIVLDFETQEISIQALTKLNDAKRVIVEQASADIDYFTKTEILVGGYIDSRYYNNTAITNILGNYTTTAHTHYLSGLTDVVLSAITNGQVLTYKDGLWVNSSFTFDTSAFISNYYTIEEFNSSASTVIINWNHMDSLPITLSGYGITDSYTKTEVYTKLELDPVPGYDSGTGILDSRYPTKTITYTKPEINTTLLGYSETGHSHNLENLYNVTGGAQSGETLIFSGNSWVPTTFTAAINNNFFTSGQTTEMLLGYSVSSHTHDGVYSFTSHTHDGVYAPSSHTHNFYDLSSTSHTHLWEDISNTSHTHDNMYYTESEINTFLLGKSDTSHTHANLYYTKTELSGDTSTGIGALDNRYYTKLLSYNRIDIDSLFYTSGQTIQYLNDNYWTSAYTNNVLYDYSLITHNHNLNGLSDVNISSLLYRDFLIWDGAYWVNSAVSFDVSNFYTKTEIDNGQLDNRYIPLTGSSNISGNLIPSQDGIYSLGSASYKWKDLFVSSGTIYIDNTQLSSDENSDLLVNGQKLALSSHTHNLSDLSNTSHTHEDIYWTKDELNGHTDMGTGVLDSRYYTRFRVNATFAQITTLNDNFYTMSATNILTAQTYLLSTAFTYNSLLNYYDSAITDWLLDFKSDKTHNHDLTGLSDVTISTLVNDDILVYNSISGVWENKQISSISPDLTPYYTSAQTDLLLSGKADTGYSFAFSALTSTSHTHVWLDLIETAHTHDFRYSPDFHGWEATGIGILDDRYYTKILTYGIEELFTSAETMLLFDNYWTSGYTDLEINTRINNSITGKSDIGHNHEFSGLTGINLTTPITSDFLMYDGSNWVNSAVSFDISNIYTKQEITSILDNYISLSGATGITGDLVPSNNGIYSLGSLTNQWKSLFVSSSTIYIDGTPVSVVNGELIVNGEIIANATEIATNYSVTSHTHDDRYFLKEQFSGDTATGIGVLDGRYYTKILAYNKIEVDTILSDYALQSDVSYILNTFFYDISQTEALFIPYYTSAQTNLLLTGKSNITHNHAFSALTSTSHTHIWSDIVNTAHTHDFYTTGEIDTKLSVYSTISSLTAHTSLTGSSNPHLTSFFDLTNTGHNHDERYWTKDDLNGSDPGHGPGSIDGRYYTKILSNNLFTTYAYVDALFSGITISGASGVFYSKHEIDVFLSGKSDIDHNHALSGLTDVTMSTPLNNDILSYNGTKWVNVDLNSLNLNLSAYYTSAQTDLLLTGKSDILHSHAFSALTSTAHTHNWLEFTNTGHSHLWSEIINTAHTHDEIYYTKTEIDNNFYTKSVTYTQTEVNNLLGNYYTSGTTDQILSDNYYTNIQIDAMLSGVTTSSTTYALSGLSDVSMTILTLGDALVYNGINWTNSSVTVDMSAYYTSSQVNGIIAGLTFKTGATILDELDDVVITSLSTSHALVYNGTNWVNSSVTIDMTKYFTSAQTISNFLSANTTKFALTSHTHALSGLSDYSGTATDLQFLQFDGTLNVWKPVTASGLLGNFVSRTGDTMSGDLTFSFMTGNTAQTDRILHVTTGGTVKEGEEIVSLYITDSSLINFITLNENNWTGRTFIPSLSSYTLYEGQKYINEYYFYEYFNGKMYRTFYADGDHNHNTLYYLKTEFSGTTGQGVLDYRYLTIDSLSSLTLSTLSDVINYDPILLTNKDYLKWDTTTSQWINYTLELSAYTLRPEVVLTGRTVIGVSGLTGGGTLNNDLQISHIKRIVNPIVNTPSPSALFQAVTFDEYGHLASYTTADYTSYWIRNLVDAQDFTLNLPRTTYDYIYWTGTKWSNTILNISRVSGLTDTLSNFVKKTGESTQTINGQVIITSDLIVNSNLTVNGTQTSINTTNLSVKDAIIFINSGITSPNVNDRSGLRVSRGDKPDYFIVFDEGSSVETSGGTLKVGVESNLRDVLLADRNPVVNGVPYWVGATSEPGYFTTTSLLTWTGSTLNLNGNINVTGISNNYGNLNAIGNLSVSSTKDKEILFTNGTVVSGNTNFKFYNSLNGAIIGGTGNTLTHDRSIILGGYDLISDATDTVYMRNLKVTGDTYLNNLTITGNLSFASLVLTNLEVTNNTTLNNLTVTGITNFTNGLNVTGLTILNGNLFVSNSISATTYYGDGSNLTGIISTHSALTGLQGGDNILKEYYHFDLIQHTNILNHTGNTNNPHSTTISGLTGVSINTLLTGHTLVYSGGSWINSMAATSNVIITGNSYEILVNSGGTSIGSYNNFYFSGNTLFVPKLESTTSGEGLVLTSSNGTRYKLTVDDSGNLITTLVV